MKQEKISIIIPVYNSEKYLKKCLDSVFSQSYNNIEVIVVNDGSTDNSDIICKKYIEKKNMIYIKIQHSGAPTARNIGLSMANGIFIMFFDSDDHLQPNAMESMYNKMKDEKADIVIGKSYVINETGKKLGIQNLYLCRNLTSQADSYFLIDPFPGNKLYKMELIKKNYDVLLKYEEEFALEIYVIMKTNNYIPKEINQYKRTAYVLNENSIRITFDRDIRATESCFDLFDENLLLNPVFNQNHVVFEVKYNGFLLSYVKDIINTIDRIQTPVSKYCLGRTNTIKYIY